jgi:hypothetical protein
MQERERKKFVEAWRSHTKDFNILAFTPSEGLSNEVKHTINKLNVLIERVADDKIAFSKRKMKKVI